MATEEKDGPGWIRPDAETARALDEWSADVRAAPHPLYTSEADRLAAFHANRKGRRQRWERAHVCMFPGCVAPSIRRSHTLPRSGPLALIAQDRHFCTPRVIDGESIRVMPIGIGEASTFPGFCRVHEDEFREIDRRKDLDEDRLWLLQFFRTVCWEIRVLEHWRDAAREDAQWYEDALRAKANEFLEARGGIAARVTKVHGIDWRQQTLDSETNRLESLLSTYHRDFLEPLRVELKGGDGDLGALVLWSQGAIIPVCLAGRGNFHVATPGGTVTVPVFLQIFPISTGTKLGMLTTKALASYLTSYVAHFNKEEFPPLRMAEAWMIHGTNHWFLQPGVWNRLSAAARERVEAEFMDENLSIGEMAREPIFDASRVQLVPYVDAE